MSKCMLCKTCAGYSNESIQKTLLKKRRGEPYSKDDLIKTEPDEIYLDDEPWKDKTDALNPANPHMIFIGTGGYPSASSSLTKAIYSKWENNIDKKFVKALQDRFPLFSINENASQLFDLFTDCVDAAANRSGGYRHPLVASHGMKYTKPRLYLNIHTIANFATKSDLGDYKIVKDSNY